MADDPLAGLIARIEAALSRAPKTGDDDDDGKTTKHVPYERFFVANQRAKAAEEALAALKAEVAKYQTETEAKVKAMTDAAGAEVGKLASRHKEDLDLVDLGFKSPLARKALRDAYETLPEASRPKTAVEHWKAVLAGVEAHRADPEKVKPPEVPETLTNFIPAPKEPEKKQEIRTGPARFSPDRSVVGGKSSAADKIRGAKSIAEVMAAAAEADRAGG